MCQIPSYHHLFFGLESLINNTEHVSWYGKISSYSLSQVSMFEFSYNTLSDVIIQFECGCGVWWFFSGLQLPTSSNS